MRTLGLISLVLLAGCPRPDLDPYAHLFRSPDDFVDASPVHATFMGVSTVSLSDTKTSILIDGFFTRPATLRKSGPAADIEPNPAVIARSLSRLGITDLAAVAVAHSHFDHVLDSPEVARQTGAIVLGSETTANIARGWELPEEQIRVVIPGERMQFGDFGVTMFITAHAPMISCEEEPNPPQRLTRPLIPPARPLEYPVGESYSILIDHPEGSALVHASAGFVPGGLDDVHADLVFLGIGRLGNQKRRCQEAYFHEVVDAVGATRVVPVHWDDMTLPLDRPLRPTIGYMSDFDGAMAFLQEQVSRRPGMELILMQAWERIPLAPSPEKPAPPGGLQ